MNETITVSQAFIEKRFPYYWYSGSDPHTVIGIRKRPDNTYFVLLDGKGVGRWHDVTLSGDVALRRNITAANDKVTS